MYFLANRQAIGSIWLENNDFTMTRFLPITLALALAGISSSGGAVVANQVGDLARYDFGSSAPPNASQIFTDFAGFDSMAVDDFTVTGPELRIMSVSGLFEARAGFASFAAVSGYQVSIFSDSSMAGSSLLGDTASRLVPLGSATSILQVGGGDHGLVSLAVDIVLPKAGTYWLGIAPVSSKAVTGQFFLQNGGADGPPGPGEANGVFSNPEEGYGIGPLTEANLDYAYLVTLVPEPATTGLLAIGVGGLLWRTRRRPQPRRRP